LEKESGIAAGVAVDDGVDRGRVIGGEIGEGLAVGGPGVGVDGGAVGVFAEADFAVGEVGEEFAVGGPAGATARGDGDRWAGGEGGAVDLAIEDVGVGGAVGADLRVAEGGQGQKGFDGPDRGGEGAKQGSP